MDKIISFLENNYIVKLIIDSYFVLLLISLIIFLVLKVKKALNLYFNYF